MSFRRLRIEEQLQTAETDTSLRLAPDGVGGAAFVTGGGGACDHRHTFERFVAAGASPETFSLSAEPMFDTVQVTVDGLTADPDTVTLVGSDVSLDTTTSQVVVVWYATSCDAPVPLVFPGAEVTHGDYTNEMASLVATGPGWVELVATADILDGGMAQTGVDLVDAAGNSSSSPDASSVFGQGQRNISAATTYIFPIPSAGTWYFVASFMVAYDPDLTGAATFTVHYPTGSPTGALTFPGSSLALDINGNQIGTFTDGPCILVLVLDSNLASGKYLGYVASSFGDGGYVVNDVAAGTYLFVVASSDTWLIFATDFGGYDGGLTDTGTYQVIPLP